MLGELGRRGLDELPAEAAREAHELALELTEVSTLLTVTSELEGVRISSEALGGTLGETPLESRISLIELMRARSRMHHSQDNPGKVVLTFSKSGYRTRATQVDIDFDRAENAFEVTLEPLGESAGAP